MGTIPSSVTSATSTTRSRWSSWRSSLASRWRTSSRRSIALCSPMGTASLFLLRVAFSTWDAPQAIPPFVMSCSFTNQVLGQLDLFRNWKENKGYKNQVYLLPKDLDEKVARLHLPALGAQLTELTKEQADYIGVKVEGPFKPDTYRY